MILIAEVRIDDINMVPWSATEVGTGRTKNNRKWRFVKKNPALEIFQANVARFAKSVMGGRKPHDGPCYLDLWLLKRTEDESLWGTPCYVPLGGQRNLRGDVTNLVKAIEDGLEEVVFVSDQLVCGGRQIIQWGASEAIQARVYAMDPNHFFPLHPTKFQVPAPPGRSQE